MKTILLSTLVVLAAPAMAQTAAPATAQSAAPTAGATVYDTAGGEVGTIAEVTPQAVVIDTGTNKVPVPPSSLGTSPKGPTFGMTKAELDAAFTKQQAEAAAQFRNQLVPGAKVFGLGGAELGTIKVADEAFVTVTTPKGDARLPIAGFGPGEKGVTVGVTAEQLAAAMGGTAAQN